MATSVVSSSISDIKFGLELEKTTLKKEFETNQISIKKLILQLSEKRQKDRKSIILKESLEEFTQLRNLIYTISSDFYFQETIEQYLANNGWIDVPLNAIQYMTEGIITQLGKKEIDFTTFLTQQSVLVQMKSVIKESKLYFQGIIWNSQSYNLVYENVETINAVAKFWGLKEIEEGLKDLVELSEREESNLNDELDSLITQTKDALPQQ